MASAPSRLLLILLLAPALSAQKPAPLGTDHFGAHWARLQTLCTPFGNQIQGTYEAQVRALDSMVRVHPADSLRLAAACIRSLQYVGSANTRSLARREAPDLDKALPGYIEYLMGQPGHPLASEALSLLALELTTSSGLDNLLGYRHEIADRMYAAVRAGVSAPSVLRACTRFELLVGDTPSARYCLHLGLTFGSDSTWHLIHSAWLAILHDQLGPAMKEMAAAKAAARSDEALGDLRTVQDLLDSVRTRTGGDTTFVHALAHAAARADFLGNDFGRCPPWFEANGTRLSNPPDICSIRKDTTAHDIDVTGVMYHLWDPKNLEPMALLTVDVPRDAVEATTLIGQRGVTADLNLRQFEWESARLRDTTMASFHFPPAAKGSASHFSSAIVVEPFDLLGSWSVGVTQFHRYGRTALDGVWPLDAAEIALSDLVVGEKAQGLSFPIGADTVILAPRNSVGTKAPVDLWFQMMNRGERRNLRASLVLRRIVAGQIAEVPALALTMSAPVVAGLSTMTREISLAHFDHGDYQLRVELLDDKGGVVARRFTNLYIK